MATRRTRATLLQILDAARKARSIFDAHRREELDDDWESAYALRLSLQILGEAAGRLSREWQDDHSEIPWSEVVGLRHVLVHGYDAVDLDILWKIAEKDLPPLITAVEALLKRVPDQER